MAALIVSPVCMKRSVGKVSCPDAFPGRNFAMAHSTSSNIISMLYIISNIISIYQAAKFGAARAQEDAQNICCSIMKFLNRDPI